ncbi:carbohydrate sulfotransferase 1-like isoform X2 [Palaemon carinicauda]|uniref:carbohydrate sulfotransferase 1-like isoform X2 n=1 Tax=Palaemon carinicauda TaxID=392227 RepID=UPI0035B69025
MEYRVHVSSCSRPNPKLLFMFCACAIFFIYLGSLTGQLLTKFLSTTKAPELQQTNINSRGFPALEEEEERGLRILVMSSVGRSGSSFLGELVAQLLNTIYIFEPLRFLQEHSAEAVTSENSKELLRSTYECHFSQDWLQFALKRNATLKSITECNRDIATIKDCLTKLCLRKRNKLLKVIRFRVSWAKELLNQDASLKVIHIVRDPRGTFQSLKSHKMVQRNYSQWCPKIQEDLEIGPLVSASFPKSFMSIKYEDLCYDPVGISLEIWSFLMGRNATSLPDTWSKYLDAHTKVSDKRQFSEYNTMRDSEKEAEAWRYEIDEQTLVGVERECAKVLELLEHNKFGSLIQARNMFLPLRRLN